jgi:hypothetical protein
MDHTGKVSLAVKILKSLDEKKFNSQSFYKFQLSKIIISTI